MASTASLPLLLDMAKKSGEFPLLIKERVRGYIRTIRQHKQATGQVWGNWRQIYRGLLQELFDRMCANHDLKKNAPKTLYAWRKAHTEYLRDLEILIAQSKTIEV